MSYFRQLLYVLPNFEHFNRLPVGAADKIEKELWSSGILYCAAELRVLEDVSKRRLLLNCATLINISEDQNLQLHHF